MKSGNFTSQRWGQTPEITRNLGNKKKRVGVHHFTAWFFVFFNLKKGITGNIGIS
jgi:hypothetical protein